MDLHFFFEREQGASAFLASLLEQRKDVRDAFFDILDDCIGGELAESFKIRRWRVRIEVDQVDIRLDSIDGAWVILVENKLQAGSKQPGQLLRYYAKQIESEPGARVVAVYLAPGAVGESEVEDVMSSDVFRQRAREENNCDFAVRISWEELRDSLSRTDTDEFIVSGMKEIFETIEKARQEKYPNEGKRKDIHQVACAVRDRLEQRFPTVKIGPPWPAKDRFILGSRGTNLTLWFILAFDAEPNPPYEPIHLLEGDNMCLTVRSMMKLSARGRRIPELKSRWDELCQSGGTINVSEVGIHKLQGRWLVHERELCAAPDRMVSELTSMGASLLRVVENWENASRSASAS